MLSESQRTTILDFLQKGIRHHENAINMVRNHGAFGRGALDKTSNIKTEFKKAEKFYEKALKIDNTNYDALRHLGIVDLDQGGFKKSERYFKKAISVWSDRYEAYNNLGSLYLRFDNIDEAVKNFNICLKLNSNYLPAINNIATLYIKLRDSEKALKNASLAYSAQPSNPIAIKNFGAAKILNGESTEGIVLIKDYLKLNSVDFEALNMLGNCYMDLGNFDLAVQYYEKALALDTNDGSAFYSLSGFKNYKVSKNDIDRFARKLSDPMLEGTNEAAKICGALYKFYEKNKNYEKAFNYLQQSNQIKNKILSPNLTHEKNYYAEIKNQFNKELIEENSKYGSKSAKPIFIVGMPRSGTTLIEQILASHSKVYGAGELVYLANILKFQSYNEENNAALKRVKSIKDWMTKENISKWGVEYLSKINDLSNTEKHVTDKLPHNFIRLGLIKILFPNSKIIYCKRDAIDNCYSLFKSLFHQPHYYFYDQKLIGLYYKMHEDLLNFWINECNIEMYCLDHEQLINNPKKIVTEVLKYCELEWEDECMNFHKNKRIVRTASNMQVREPINKKSIRAWGKYEDNLQLMIKTLQ